MAPLGPWSHLRRYRGRVAVLVETRLDYSRFRKGVVWRSSYGCGKSEQEALGAALARREAGEALEVVERARR